MTLLFRAEVRERDYDVAFSVGDAETVALLGPNGAGKSTTIDLLAGLIRPDRGLASFGDDILFRVGAAERQVWLPPHERRVALLAQDGLLFPHLTARDNVGFGSRSRGAGVRESREIAGRWLAEVDASDLAGHRPRTLSGGQRQRVALARALASGPRLVLLDEPMASLDAGAVPAMRELLSRVLSGLPAVLVTHDPLDALALAERVVVLEEGRIVRQGVTREVLGDPSTEFLRQLTLGLRER